MEGVMNDAWGTLLEPSLLIIFLMSGCEEPSKRLVWQHPDTNDSAAARIGRWPSRLPPRSYNDEVISEAIS